MKKAKNNTKLPVQVKENVKNPLSLFYSKGLIKIEKETKLVGNSLVELDRLSTSVLSIDWVLGGGLVPSLYQFSGQEASAKTTTTLHCLANAINSNLAFTTFVDAEGSASPKYTNSIFKPFGINVNDYLNDRSLGFSYYRSNVIERVFDNIVKRLDLMPSKIWSNEAKQWMYIFPKRDAHFKSMMEALNIKPDIKLSTDNLYYAPASHGGAEAFIAVDSWAAMLPEAEEEAQEKSNQRAIQANAFSQHLKRIAAKISEKGVIVLGINQLRTKPVATMGAPEIYEPCFVGNTTVLLADGTLKTIRNIVKNKLKVEVKSFDKKTGEISNKPIIGWKENGYVETKNLVVLGYKSFDKYSVKRHREIECTKNHKIWTPTGWVEADKLKVKDKIYLHDCADIMSEDAYQVYIGSLLGDGVIKDCETKKTFRMVFDTMRQSMHYVAWKGKVIDGNDPYDIKPNVFNNFTVRGKIASYKTNEINNIELKKLSYLRSKFSDWTSSKANCLFKKIIEDLNIKGLAVWYMDDGSFYFDKGSYSVSFRVSRLSKKQAFIACEKINKLTNANFKVCYFDGKVHSIITKGKVNVLAYFDAVKKYIHPTYFYKLYSIPDTSYKWDFSGSRKENLLRETEILYKNKSKRKAKSLVYDLTIKDNHTYFVGGLESSTYSGASDCIAVSNCGSALNFYSGARLRYFSRSPSAEPRFEREDKTSNMIEKSVEGNGFDRYVLKEVQNTKNKFGTPFLKTYIRVWISDHKASARGIDPVFDTIKHLESTNQGKFYGGAKGYITFNLKPSFGEKRSAYYNQQKISYEKFKRIILAEHTKNPNLIKSLKEEGWNAPLDFREYLFKQMSIDQSIFLPIIKEEKEKKATEEL